MNLILSLIFSIVSSLAYQHEFLTFENNKIEIFWDRPQSAGIHPLILYIHGHQAYPTSGGAQYATPGVLKNMAEKGYVAVAISQPGYGGSSGPADFCGPKTQNAVKFVLEYFKSKDFVNSKKMALIGVSRGAIVASMVATQNQSLAGVVLISGFYDLENTLYELEQRSTHNSDLAQMVFNIKSEIGNDSWRFANRSALLHVEKIKSPLLILNGALDDRTFDYQSNELAHLVSAGGTEAKAVIFPNVGHNIPMELRNQEIIPFIQKHLKN